MAESGLGRDDDRTSPLRGNPYRAPRESDSRGASRPFEPTRLQLVTLAAATVWIVFVMVRVEAWNLRHPRLSGVERFFADRGEGHRGKWRVPGCAKDGDFTTSTPEACWRFHEGVKRGLRGALPGPLSDVERAEMNRYLSDAKDQLAFRSFVTVAAFTQYPMIVLVALQAWPLASRARERRHRRMGEICLSAAGVCLAVAYVREYFGSLGW